MIGDSNSIIQITLLIAMLLVFRSFFATDTNQLMKKISIFSIKSAIVIPVRQGVLAGSSEEKLCLQSGNVLKLLLVLFRASCFLDNYNSYVKRPLSSHRQCCRSRHGSVAEGLPPLFHTTNNY